MGKSEEKKPPRAPGLDGRIMLKCNGKAWIGLIWFRIVTSGGLFWRHVSGVGFHKMWGIPGLAEQLFACEQGALYVCSSPFGYDSWVVFYGCETWSLTLRGENRLRMFENRALGKIFGPKRNGVTGEWVKLHSDDLNVRQCSQNIIRMIETKRMSLAWHVARMGEKFV